MLLLGRVGLCGLDDATDLTKLLVDTAWPSFVEFGVLIREERAGTPRCPTWPKIEEMMRLNQGRYKFAAHLCSHRCEEFLRGDGSLVRELLRLGFSRVQINATRANGVDSSMLDAERAGNVLALASQIPGLEFIVQRNDETKPLWHAIEQASLAPPANISMLFDASVGRGIVLQDFARPLHARMRAGYAGGINPGNCRDILLKLAQVPVPPGAPWTWIDMESGVRDPRGDLFDMAKALQVMDVVKDLAARGVLAVADVQQ
jgi:hypothetical protein